MKKTFVLIIALLFVLCGLGNVTLVQASSGATLGKIGSENAARDLASKAGGQYIEGMSAPATEGNQVALPIMNESGEVQGHIVADKDRLIETLNSEGYEDVASALAAAETTAEAGESAGLIAESGIAAGTVGKVAAAAAGVAGIAAAVSSGDSSTTSSHH